MEEQNQDTVVEEKQVIVDNDSITEEDANGSIQISRDVMSAIVRKFTLKVPGVIRFQTQSLTDSMLDILGKRSSDRSIQIDIDENGADITVGLILEFGVEIPKVCHDLQDILRERLQTLTGMHVRKINVNVLDLEEPEEVPEEKPEEEPAPAEEPAEEAPAEDAPQA